MNDVEQKVWGTAKHFQPASNVLVSILTVKQGFRSSWHTHAARANRFDVVSGAIVIEYKHNPDHIPDFPILRRVVVGPGEHFAIPAGVEHRFRVLYSGHVVETYTAEALFEDINRIDEGGPDDQADLREIDKRWGAPV